MEQSQAPDESRVLVIYTGMSFISALDVMFILQ